MTLRASELRPSKRYAGLLPIRTSVRMPLWKQPERNGGTWKDGLES